jgi:hypothetical protein
MADQPAFILFGQGVAFHQGTQAPIGAGQPVATAPTRGSAAGSPTLLRQARFMVAGAF